MLSKSVSRTKLATKDFGIRASVSNNINSNIFQAEFYAYGNIPSITGYVISDAGTTGYFVGPAYDTINVDIEFANNIKYVNIDRFDVYASTGEDITLSETDESNPNGNPAYLYTQKTQNLSQVVNISIKPVALAYNTNYYFAVVPYSSLGSGSAIYFGPCYFGKYTTGISDIVVSSNKFELFNGTESVTMDIITGSLSTGDSGLFDTIESGIYNTIFYNSQVTGPTGDFISSELKLVINTGSITLLETPVNNTGQLSYSTGQSGIYTTIILSGVGMSGASFKASRTLF